MKKLILLLMLVILVSGCVNQGVSQEQQKLIITEWEQAKNDVGIYEQQEYLGEFAGETDNQIYSDFKSICNLNDYGGFCTPERNTDVLYKCPECLQLKCCNSIYDYDYFTYEDYVEYKNSSDRFFEYTENNVVIKSILADKIFKRILEFCEDNGFKDFSGSPYLTDFVNSDSFTKYWNEPFILVYCDNGERYTKVDKIDGMIIERKNPEYEQEDFSYGEYFNWLEEKYGD